MMIGPCGLDGLRIWHVTTPFQPVGIVKAVWADKADHVAAKRRKP